MQDTDPQWKVLRCPHCDGLMKVDAHNVPDSLGCPSCGDTFVDPGKGVSQAQPEIDVPAGVGDVVIRSSDAVPELPESEAELELDEELGVIPKIEPLRQQPSAPDMAIPAPRREEYKTPDMISNIGERARTPEKDSAPEPVFDAGRLASIDDERFAPVADNEEGAVKAHVARKITGWDMDDDEGAVDGDSLIDQIKAKLGIIVIGLVSVLFLCLLGYGLLHSMGGEEVKTKSADREKIDVARESLTSVERDTLDDRKKTFAEAGAVIEQFLNAKDYKERSALVRDSERVAPLMESYYQNSPDGPIEFRVPKNGWQLTPFKSFLLGEVENEDFSRTSIAVKREADGRFLVDWESFVGYCEIPWDRIVEEKPTTPFLVRVKASIGDYYNYGYTDSEWACARLDSDSTEHTVYGYVKLDDPVLSDMKKVMTRSGVVHVTMRLAHPGGNKAPNQFLITELVSKGWVFSVDGDDPEKTSVE